MSIPTLALLFTIGIGLSLAVSTAAYIAGRVSAAANPEPLTTTEEVQESMKPFGLKPFPIEQRYIRRPGVFATVVITGLLLGIYVMVMTVVVSFGGDGQIVSLGARALDTIIALVVGVGWGLSVPLLFASLGLARTEDGPVYMRRSVRLFLVALTLAVALFVAHTIVVAVIH